MGLDVTYKGEQIAQLTEDGNLTLETAGKYCEGDIELTYSGGGTDFDDFVSASYPSGDMIADSATVIDPYVCCGRTGITSIYSLTVEDIREHAFCNCSNLVAVEFPNLTVIRNGTGTNTNADGQFFSNCNILNSVKMPKLVNIYGNLCFATTSGNNSNLVIVLPKIQNLGVRAFRQRKCSAVDLGPDLVGILADTFYNGNVATLILRKLSVVPASSTDSIDGLHDVYVPRSLIDTYKTSSNWSTRFTGGYITFHAIEGSQYETAYADGTPIT